MAGRFDYAMLVKLYGPAPEGVASVLETWEASR
jgi:hypothetical protein